MLRNLRKEDVKEISSIWLKGNLSSHDFIPAEHWKQKKEEMIRNIEKAEAYVFEDGSGIQGFIGLDGDMIHTIYIRNDFCSKGIGKNLLEFVKRFHINLTTTVYEKNERAVRFFKREGFCVTEETEDKEIKEKKYVLRWKKE